MRFSGKVAVVTGAGSGIGQATRGSAGQRRGRSWWASDINEAGLEGTTGMMDEEAAFHAAVSDVRSRDACHELVASVVADHGRLDVLCNVAGVARGHRVGDVDQATWDLIMGVNVEGMFWMSQAALPHLEASGGNIVNIASNAGLMGQAYTVPYCASKGAVVLMTKAMAMETMKTGVRVNAIAPGGVETNLTAAFGFPPRTRHGADGAVHGDAGHGQCR